MMTMMVMVMILLLLLLLATTAAAAVKSFLLSFSPLLLSLLYLLVVIKQHIINVLFNHNISHGGHDMWIYPTRIQINISRGNQRTLVIICD